MQVHFSSDDRFLYNVSFGQKNVSVDLLPSRIKQGNKHSGQILWALEKPPIFWDANPRILETVMKLNEGRSRHA